MRSGEILPSAALCFARPEAALPSGEPACIMSSRFSFKKGIFLTVLRFPAAVNVAELLPLVVVVTLVAYSAAKGRPWLENATQ